MNKKNSVSMSIPMINSIEQFFHCASCLGDRPEGTSPRDWARLEAGFTRLGIQVWCKRCEKNVCHIDFEGQKHPAMLHAAPKP